MTSTKSADCQDVLIGMAYIIGDMSDKELKAMDGQLGIPIHFGTSIADESSEEPDEAEVSDQEETSGYTKIMTVEELKSELESNIQRMDEAMRSGLFKPSELEPYTSQRFNLITALDKRLAQGDNVLMGAAAI